MTPFTVVDMKLSETHLPPPSSFEKTSTEGKVDIRDLGVNLGIGPTPNGSRSILSMKLSISSCILSKLEKGLPRKEECE